MIKRVQTLMKIMSLVSGKERAYPIKRTNVWYQKQKLWTWSVTWTNGHRRWSVSLLGISANYVHLIPHSRRGESLKTLDQKKKKKSARDQLAFTDPRRGLQKNALPNFPAGVSVPLDCQSTIGGPLLSGVKDYSCFSYKTRSRPVVSGNIKDLFACRKMTETFISVNQQIVPFSNGLLGEHRDEQVLRTLRRTAQCLEEGPYGSCSLRSLMWLPGVSHYQKTVPNSFLLCVT